MRIILASKSPRRKELLSLITKDFEVIESDFNEEVNENLIPEEKVKKIAQEKARDVLNKISKEDAIIISGDTIVVVDNEILGKPKDKEDAIRMLKLLAGRSHEVMTAISIIILKNGEVTEKTECDISNVHVKQLSDDDIEKWLNTGNAWDKAGAYAIQQEFAVHIDKINGNYSTIVGLPIHRVYDIIKDLV